jgi:membrane protein DedA with SNARE-associated domain
MPSFIATDTIPSLLMHYGYFIFFPITVVEGPVVTVIAGLLSSLGYFNIYIIYILAVLGDLFGDVLYYWLGHIGGKHIRVKGKFLGISVKYTESLEDHFKQHLGKTLLFGKLTHSIGAPILMAAGVSRVPFGKYIWYNFIGTIPKVFIFVLIGYYFGISYKQFNTYFNYVTVLVLLPIILIVAIVITIKIIKKKVEKE